MRAVHNLSKGQLHEINSILSQGKRVDKGTTRIEYLGYTFLKYLRYCSLSNWRRGASHLFNDCPLSKGQRTQAIQYLHKKKIIIYDNNRRMVHYDFVTAFALVEKEINKKEGVCCLVPE